MVDDWKSVLLKEKKDLLIEQVRLREKTHPIPIEYFAPGDKTKRYTYTPKTQKQIRDIDRLEAIVKRLVEIDKDLGIYPQDNNKSGD